MLANENTYLAIKNQFMDPAYQHHQQEVVGPSAGVVAEKDES